MNITLLIDLAANHEAVMSAECSGSLPDWISSGADLLACSRRVNKKFSVVSRVEMRSNSSRKRPHMTHELIIIPEETVESSILLVHSQKVKRKPTGVRAKARKK